MPYRSELAPANELDDATVASMAAPNAAVYVATITTGAAALGTLAACLAYQSCCGGGPEIPLMLLLASVASGIGAVGAMSGRAKVAAISVGALPLIVLARMQAAHLFLGGMAYSSSPSGNRDFDSLSSRLHLLDALLTCSIVAGVMVTIIIPVAWSAVTRLGLGRRERLIRRALRQL